MTISCPPPPKFIEQCNKLDLVISEQQLVFLEEYLRILLETNQQFNLTAVREPEEAWFRHILDSIAILPLIDPNAKRLIDLGSGGGLPAIPLAIMLPDTNVVMVDSVGKKCAFLEDVVEALELNADVFNERAEVLGQDEDFRESFDVCTARAVARMPILLEYMLPLTMVGGTAIAMKGRQGRQELKEAKQAIHKLGQPTVSVHQSRVEDDSVIICCKKNEETPNQYPRPVGVPSSTPL